MRPLADEIRPQTLDDVAGQKHLLGEGALLRRLIENGTDANLIFYGPSGTGKTTVANNHRHYQKHKKPKKHQKHKGASQHMNHPRIRRNNLWRNPKSRGKK